MYSLPRPPSIYYTVQNHRVSPLTQSTSLAHVSLPFTSMQFDMVSLVLSFVQDPPSSATGKKLNRAGCGSDSYRIILVTQEPEASVSYMRGQAGQPSENLSQNNKTKRVRDLAQCCLVSSPLFPTILNRRHHKGFITYLLPFPHFTAFPNIQKPPF